MSKILKTMSGGIAKPYRGKKKPVFYTAKWYLNNKCNMDCPFCLTKKMGNELPFSEKEKILEYLITDLRVKEVDFFGKEVLVNDEAIFLMQKIRGRVPFRFITNGKNLMKYKQEILNLSDKGLYQFAVSHDLNTVRDFSLNPKHLKEFSEAGIITELSIDINRKNIDNIIPFILEGHADSYFLKAILPYTKNKKGEYADSISVSGEEMAELILALNKAELKSEVMVSILPYAIKVPEIRVDNPRLNVRIDSKCGYGENMLFIDPSGEAYGCGHAALCSNTKRHCNLLGTPISELKKILSTDGRRVCLET